MISSSFAQDVLLGFTVGDALGVATSGLNPLAIRQKLGFVRNMLGGGRHSLPPGQGTALTEIALLVAESIGQVGGYNPDDVFRRLTYLATKDVPGFPRSWTKGLLGETSLLVEVNVSELALILPFVYLTAISDQECDGMATSVLRRLGRIDSFELSHRFLALLRALGRGQLAEAIPDSLTLLSAHLENGGAPTSLMEDCLPLAFSAVSRSASFGESLLRVVALGGETSATTAVAGAFAAARWGMKAIPDKWIDLLRVRKRVAVVSALL